MARLSGKPEFVSSSATQGTFPNTERGGIVGKILLVFRATVALLVLASCVGENMREDPEAVARAIIDTERAALDRWRQGDPHGFLEIIADDYTYFDPSLDERVDGREAISGIYEAIRGQVSFPAFELIDPRVQVEGDVAVLTFNFTSSPPESAGPEIDLDRWHATEIFRRLDGEWRLISTHWSFTQSLLLELAEGGQLTLETPAFPVLDRVPPPNGIPREIVDLERTALDRWGAGDPGGYLDIIAEEYTYFDPSLEKRIDDLPAMRDYLEPIRGQVRTSRYEMLEPYVQTDGTTAVLTFNLRTYGVAESGTETLDGHWHATEVYRRAGSEWRLISTHWSFTKSWLEQLAGRV